MIMMLDLLFAGDLIIKEGSVGTKMYFIQVPSNSMNFIDEIKHFRKASLTLWWGMVRWLHHSQTAPISARSAFSQMPGSFALAFHPLIDPDNWLLIVLSHSISSYLIWSYLIPIQPIISHLSRRVASVRAETYCNVFSLQVQMMISITDTYLAVPRFWKRLFPKFLSKWRGVGQLLTKDNNGGRGYEP